MAIQQTDIDIFLNKAQQKIASIGNEARDLDDQGECIDDKITMILQLSSAVNLLQESESDSDTDLTDDEKWEIISTWNKKADLTTLPLGIFDSSCLVDTVLVGAGYLTGPQGPQGPQGIQGPQGPSGADGTNGSNGADGTNGWSSIPALVDYNGGKIIQIAGWTGGTGSAPSSGVYVGSNGFVTDPSQAVNIQGPTGATGSQGLQGLQGNDGQSSYTYIAYASDDTGTGFTLVFDPSLDYIAIKSTTTQIVSPVSSDFSGLWKNYKGAKGDRFIIDAQGPLSGRDTYDTQNTGFSYLDTDNGVIYIKLSPLSGDWGGPYQFQGYQGWSPLYANVADGNRIVQQIVDWTGGEGTKPGVTNLYIGPTGIVNTVTDGTDIRGLQGERFFPDASGTTAGRSAYDSQVAEFVYYATDTGQVSIKNTSTSGDWSSWYDWRGAQGPAGPTGSAGNGFSSDCRVATTANLSATYDGTGKTLTSNSNGAISIDSVSPSIGDRVLVKDQSTGSQNGIYKVTDAGSAGTPWILTRDVDFDTTFEVQKFTAVIVKEGTTNTATRWTLTNSRPSITLDTTSLIFISQNVTSYVPIDGDLPLEGNLDLGGFNIQNVNLVKVLDGGGIFNTSNNASIVLDSLGNIIFSGVLNANGNNLIKLGNIQDSLSKIVLVASTRALYDSNANPIISFLNRSTGVGILTNASNFYGYIKSDNILSNITLQVGNAGIIAVTSDIPTSLPPSGSAGGDLSGSYPSPTVAKINGNAIPANASGYLYNDGLGGLSWSSAASVITNNLLNSNSIVSTDLLSNWWKQIDTQLATVYPNFNATADNYGSVIINPLGTGSGTRNGLFAFFNTGSLFTSVKFQITAKLPTGVVSSTFSLVIYNSLGTIIVDRLDITLTSSYVTYSKITTGLAANTQYYAAIIIHDGVTVNNAEVEVQNNGVQLIPQSSSSTILAGSFSHIQADRKVLRNSLLDNFRSYTGSNSVKYYNYTVQTNSFSNIGFFTNAPKLLIQATSNMGAISSAKLGIKVNDRYYDVAQFTTTLDDYQYYEVILPSGYNKIEIINGAQTVGNGGSGTWIDKIYYDSSNTLELILPDDSPDSIVVWGDSTSVGGDTSLNTFWGWTEQLREITGHKIINMAVGGRSLNDYTSTLDLLAYQLTRKKPKILIIVIGVNDYQLNAQNATNFGINYGILLDHINRYSPGTHVMACSPFTTTVEATANTFGNTLNDYRNNISQTSYGAITLRKGFATYIDTTGWTTAADINSGNVHPSPTGYAKIATNMVSQIDTILGTNFSTRKKKTTVGDVNYTATVNDSFISFNTNRTAARTATLPVYYFLEAYTEITIVDEYGVAGTYPIIVKASTDINVLLPGSDKINNLPCYIINWNYGQITFKWNGNMWVVKEPIARRTIFNQTSDQTITNSILATTIFGSGVGLKTFQADELTQAGKNIKVKFAGVYSTPVTPGTLTFVVSLGGTTIANKVTTALLGSTTNGAFRGEIDITVRITGTTGTVITDGYITYVSSGGKTTDDLNNAGATTTINTTVANALDITAQWDTADVGKIFKTTISSIEI